MDLGQREHEGAQKCLGMRVTNGGARVSKRLLLTERAKLGCFVRFGFTTMPENVENPKTGGIEQRTTKKSIAGFLTLITRSDRRSPLFWWFVDHFEDLRMAELEGGLGIPWRKLCVKWAAEGITSSGGRPITAETAKKTWQRVRKEMVRVTERKARELAERQERQSTDPRRNMPSRFPKGMDFSPQIVPTPAKASSGALVAIAAQLPVASSGTNGSDDYWKTTELPEELSDRKAFDYDGTRLDLRQFIREDVENEPWNADKSLSPRLRKGLLINTVMSRANEWATNRIDRSKRRKW